MPTLLVLTTILVLALGLWLAFKRLSAPSKAPLPPASPKPFAVPDQLAWTLRCPECGRLKPMPTAAQPPLSLTLALVAPPPTPPCPGCTTRMQLWLRRDIIHQGPKGPVALSELRTPTQVAYIWDDGWFSSFADLPPLARATVAEALNMTEDVDDCSW